VWLIKLITAFNLCPVENGSNDFSPRVDAEPFPFRLPNWCRGMTGFANNTKGIEASVHFTGYISMIDSTRSNATAVVGGNIWISLNKLLNKCASTGLMQRLLKVKRVFSLRPIASWIKYFCNKHILKNSFINKKLEKFGHCFSYRKKTFERSVTVNLFLSKFRDFFFVIEIQVEFRLSCRILVAASAVDAALDAHLCPQVPYL